MTATDRHSLVCVTTSAAFGGAETSLLTMLIALRALEPHWAITVITPRRGPLNERCRQAGIASVELPFPAALTVFGESAVAGARRRPGGQLQELRQAAAAAISLPPYLAALRSAVRAAAATVVHTNGLKAHVAAAVIKPPEVRLVWHLHEYVGRRPLSLRLMRRLAHRADAIVANSDSVLQDAAAVFGGATPLRCIHNAVDPRVFTPEGEPLPLATRAGLGPDEGLVRIGLVATFARWKGHEVFLEAIARLAPLHPIRAYVIGGAVYETSGSQWSEAELKAQAAALGLSAVVGFTGHVDDVPAALRSLDIVVHASTEPEPFGMVIAEGMAARRAVVVAHAGGAAELFADNVEAIGYHPGDAGELARRLEALVTDQRRRDALAQCARAAALARFSPARMAGAFREVYAG